MGKIMLDRRSKFSLLDRGSPIQISILDRGSWIADPIFMDRGSWIAYPKQLDRPISVLMHVIRNLNLCKSNKL